MYCGSSEEYSICFWECQQASRGNLLLPKIQLEAGCGNLLCWLCSSEAIFSCVYRNWKLTDGRMKTRNEWTTRARDRLPTWLTTMKAGRRRHSSKWRLKRCTCRIASQSQFCTWIPDCSKIQNAVPASSRGACIKYWAASSSLSSLETEGQLYTLKGPPSPKKDRIVTVHWITKHWKRKFACLRARYLCFRSRQAWARLETWHRSIKGSRTCRRVTRTSAGSRWSFPQPAHLFAKLTSSMGSKGRPLTQFAIEGTALALANEKEPGWIASSFGNEAGEGVHFTHERDCIFLLMLLRMHGCKLEENTLCRTWRKGVWKQSWRV